MDCFGTYFTHVQSSNVTRVQSATEWTASVLTLHMSKRNVTPNGLLRYLLYTCPNLMYVVFKVQEWTALVHTLQMSKPNVTRVQSATEWTASVHTLHMSKPNVTGVQSAAEWTGLLRYILFTPWVAASTFLRPPPDAWVAAASVVLLVDGPPSKVSGLTWGVWRGWMIFYRFPVWNRCCLKQ